MIHPLFISVIIPCKNVEKFIERAIVSILNQTYQNFEIIIINDGSTDNTEYIIKTVIDKDKRIKYISFKESKGLCEALNAGTALSQFDWIARMDGDDISLPNRLERQVEYIKKYPDVKLLGCLPYYIDENDRVIGKMNLNTFTPEEFKNKISKGKLIFIPGGASIIHKPTLQKLGNYKKEFEFMEDLEMNMRFALNGHLVLNVPEYLYMYRKRELTNTSNAFLVNKRMRWIKERVRCKMKGEPEPNFEEYCKIEASKSLLEKLKIFQADYGTYYFKRFGASLAQKNTFHALIFFIISILIKPGYVFIKIKPQFNDILNSLKKKLFITF